MAVPELTPNKEYTANGSVTSFALGFICDSKNDLIVLVDNVAPPVATWSLVGNNAVFTTAPASGKKIVLQRNTAMSRTTNYQGNNNSFRPETINKDIDRVWLKLQELGVADMLLKIYVDRLHGEQKDYIDNKDQLVRNIIADLRNYVNQQDGSLSSDIDNLRTHVDQQDNSRNSYFENLINRQGVSLQQLDSYYKHLLQGIANIAAEKGWLASLVTDASGRSQQWVNDKKTLKTFYDFGAKGDGVTDDTTAIRLATVYSAMYNVGIVQNDGEFLVSTFDQTLSDGIVCAIPIAGNLNLSGTGRIKSNTTTVNRAIFGVDSRANNKNIKINGVKFGGPRRYRVIHSTGDATLDSIDFSCVHTELQSIVLTSAYKKSIKVNNNKLGTAIDATTPITPFMEINIPLDSPHIPSYEVCRNSLWGGTETRTGTSYGFKNIPVGGKCDDNFLCNIGKSETEGFDIDGLGSFASFSGNVAIYSGFEYKPLVTGFYSRDAIFNNNISYESFGAAFSLRSSIKANGNIAYNPTQFGLLMGVGGDPNGYVLNHGVADVSGFKIIWAGSTMDNAVRIENVFKRIVFDKLEITIDPAYATSNPTAKLSATSSGLITIIGDVNHVQFNDLLIGKSAVDQVNIRATTKAGTIIFNNPNFSDSDASCIDAQNVNNLVIHDPIFGNAADRPLRISLCDNVDIVSREYPFLANVLTTGTNTNALVYGFGIQAVGVDGAPTNPYRLGAIVQNSIDSSVWLKINTTWV